MQSARSSQRRGQIAFEFMIVYSFVLVVFLIVFVLIATQRAATLNAQEYSSLQLVAQNVAGYIDQAVFAGSGYNASIAMTGAIGTAPYNVIVSSTGVVVASTMIGGQVLTAYAFSSARNLVINGTLASASTNSIRLYVLPNSTGYFDIYNLGGVVYVDQAPAPTSALAQSLSVSQIANIKAADFDGVSSGMTENGVALLNNQSNFTITAWVDPQSFGNSIEDIYTEGSPTNGVTLSFGVNSSGNEVLCVFNSGTTMCTTSTRALATGKWQFVSAQLIMGTAAFYLNNTNSTHAFTFENSIDSKYIGIGYDVGNSLASQPFNGFDGLIADVQVYNATLTKAELAQLDGQGIASPPISGNNLLAWYRLDGNGYDYSGRLHPLYQNNVSYRGVAQLSISQMDANGSTPFVSFGAFNPQLSGVVSTNGTFGPQGSFAGVGTESVNCERNQTPALTFSGALGTANVTVTLFNGNASFVNGCGTKNLPLVGWWPLNEGFGISAHDLSGFNSTVTETGSLGGYPSWQLISRNFSNFMAANFPGNVSSVLGWITAPQINAYNDIVRNNSVSVVAWVNYKGALLTGSSGPVGHRINLIRSQGIFGDEVLTGAIPTEGFQLGVNGSRCSIAFIVGVNVLSDPAATCINEIDTGLSVGNWTMVVGEYSSTGVVSLYINNTLVASQYVGSEPLTSDLPMNIGNDAWQSSGSDTFCGIITNVQLYGSALNQSAVNYLYKQGAAGVPISNGTLLGWWPLNGNANDLSVNRNNGTLQGTVTFNNLGYSSYPLRGRPQYAFAFNPDSGNQLVSPTSDNILTGDHVTVAAWIDPSSMQDNASYNGYFSYGGTPPMASCSGSPDEVGAGIQSSGVPMLTASCDSFIPANGPSVNFNTWNFVADMLNGTNSYIYINGAWLNGTLASPGASVDIVPGNVVIGAFASARIVGPGENIFNGSVADVQLYNTTLTKEQVMQLYQQGLPPTYRINVTAGQGDSGQAVPPPPPVPHFSTLIANVADGPGSYFANYDPGNGYVYVPSSSSSSVYVYSGTSTVGTVSVGSAPYYAAYDPTNGYMYVAQGSSSVYVLSGTSVAGTISIGSGGEFDAYDSGAGDVYVPLSSAAIYIVAGTSTVVNSLSFGGSSSPFYPVYDSGNGDMYVSDLGTDDVYQISGNTILNTIAVGSLPYYELYDPGNGYVYAINDGSGTVNVISGSSVVGTVTVGSGPYAATYDPRNGYVYVSNHGTNTVSVLSGTSLVATITVGMNPLYSTYDPANGYIYIPDLGSGTVSVISGTSVVDTITVQTDPFSATYDSANNYVYVPNLGSDTVSVISTG